MDASIFESSQNHYSKEGISKHNRMVNRVDPDETAHNEPSQHDLHSLQNSCFGLQGRKG